MRPPASRVARATALLGCAVLLLALVAHGWQIAVDDPSRSPLVSMRTIEREGDYVAWTSVFAPGSHVSVLWTANDTPERIVLLRQGDLDALLSGGTPALTEFEPPSIPFGRLDFAAPSPECPPPTGACTDASMPVLVWMKGDAWRGARAVEGEHYAVLGETWNGPIVQEERHEGPVRPDIAHANEGMISSARTWLFVAAAGGGLALLAALAHLALELRRPREPLVPDAPPAESTQTLLMLARLTTLYVDSVRRSFVTAVVAIAGITAAALVLGLPPMLEQISEQFRNQWELMELHVALFTLGPLCLALVACVLWLASWWRIQRELRHWRRMTRAFEEEAARLVGA